VRILTQRSFFQTKGVAIDLLEFVNTIFIAVMVGLLYFQSPREESRISDRIGAIFFAVAFSAFFNPAFKALFDFPQERDVVNRERLSGSYRLSAYYLAKLVADMPFAFLFPSIFWVIVYFLIGLKLDVGSFFFSYLIILLTTFASVSMGIFVSCLAAPSFKKMVVILSCLLLTFMMSAGFYVQNFPKWLFWIQYLSFMAPGYQPLLINDFTGTVWKRTNVNSTETKFANYDPIPGQAILHTLPLWFDNMWYYMLIVLGWGIFYRIAGFFALQWSLKPKT